MPGHTTVKDQILLNSCLQFRFGHMRQDLDEEGEQKHAGCQNKWQATREMYVIRTQLLKIVSDDDIKIEKRKNWFCVSGFKTTTGINIIRECDGSSLSNWSR